MLVMNSGDMFLARTSMFEFAVSICRICSGCVPRVLQKTFTGYLKQFFQDGGLRDLLEMLLVCHSTYISPKQLKGMFCLGHRKIV